MTTAAERIGKYLKTREVYPMKQLGDGIHVVQAGSEWEAELRLSDLREFHNSHASLVEKVERLREALTPSGETKAAYMGEFSIGFPDVDENGIEYTRKINVPWTTIKEIMAAIRERANA